MPSLFTNSDNQRDPSVYREGDTYHIFYSRYSNGDWNKKENWAVAHIKTKDFIHFYDDSDLSPKGFASPGDVIRWNGEYIIPYQSYPDAPSVLCFSRSDNLENWSEPVSFLKEALELPWNSAGRAIDPTFVVCGDTLHCYFTGSDDETYGHHTNLIGHAYTTDRNLENWTVTSVNKPFIGTSENAPDGAENLTVFRRDDDWMMIYSEGLLKQHLAYAVSKDLQCWEFCGQPEIPVEEWMIRKYGAPFVWKEGVNYYMLLMGENADGRTSLGLLGSKDGIRYKHINPRQSNNGFFEIK